ncbi:MAG: sigma 54-interacting transcriptional regulator [Gemmataceae bacterium]|nr:sigma 54-interacting transcriptional regulator [Gemmataceae bacterium]
MDPARDIADDGRWPSLFRRGREPLFVLNRRRRIIFVNPAWEALTQVTPTEARGITCTTREIGHARADLAAALAPPAEVFAGQSVQVRRPAPGKDGGPPWWDIDFLPVLGDDRPVGILARIHVVSEPEPSKSMMPTGWGEIRVTAIRRFSWSLWESSVPAVRRVVTQARLAAETGCSVAIVGSLGTGKQMLARTIHAESPRRESTCVALECDRLPPDAVRAALKQAGNIGLVYLANPASLPRDLQVELARSLPARLQLVVGFTTDPAAEIREGRLAEEFWSVAATMVIQLPRLVERSADLPLLLGRLAAGKSLHISNEVMDLIRSADWPGNLDDLERWLATRATGTTIDVAELPWAVRQSSVPSAVVPPLPPLDELLAQVEERMIRLALARSGGNKQKAANLLGVWRPRLLRRMEALKITDAGGPD